MGLEIGLCAEFMFLRYMVDIIKILTVQFFTSIVLNILLGRSFCLGHMTSHFIFGPLRCAKPNVQGGHMTPQAKRL